MYDADASVLHQLPYLLLHLHVERLLGLYHMTFNAHGFHPLYHLAVGEGQADGLVCFLVEKLHKVQQMALASAYLALADDFQYLCLISVLHVEDNCKLENLACKGNS